MSAYRRLLPFLRPHGWRMAVSIAANVFVLHGAITIP